MDLHDTELPEGWAERLTELWVTEPGQFLGLFDDDGAYKRMALFLNTSTELLKSIVERIRAAHPPLTTSEAEWEMPSLGLLIPEESQADEE